MAHALRPFPHLRPRIESQLLPSYPGDIHKTHVSFSANQRNGHTRPEFHTRSCIPSGSNLLPTLLGLPAPTHPTHRELFPFPRCQPYHTRYALHAPTPESLTCLAPSTCSSPPSPSPRALPSGNSSLQGLHSSPATATVFPSKSLPPHRLDGARTRSPSGEAFTIHHHHPDDHSSLLPPQAPSGQPLATAPSCPPPPASRRRPLNGPPRAPLPPQGTHLIEAVHLLGGIYDLVAAGAAGVHGGHSGVRVCVS